MSDQNSGKKFWKQGEPFIWVTATAQVLVLLCVFGLGLVILFNGIFVFWPKTIKEFQLADNQSVLGEIVESEIGPKGLRHLIKVGNRDLLPQDFVWIDDEKVTKEAIPKNTVVLERLEEGNFYGYFDPDQNANYQSWDQFSNDLDSISEKREDLNTEFKILGKISDDIEECRLELKDENLDPEQRSKIIEKQTKLENEYSTRLQKLEEENVALEKSSVSLKVSSGESYEIPLAHIIRAWQPNQMSILEKCWHYAEKIYELLFDEPRESNTEGGLMPAIVGTVMLVFLMSLVAFPLGLIAGIYLAEYAKEGNILRIVRIAVNNLAGIPSIVYGIFGLGFFVYGIGSTMDEWFFSERLPEPTFGTGGILWASLTLSLLTVPVVIVATEEALRTVPSILKNGSLALGATRFQTLIRVLIPAAAPGILTGFILAMARSAGEVAPLMVTGVVKLAPTLPFDSEFPFFHLDRKFMHLGFHIYDVGFQSPNAEAARPMVFITTLLLVGVVLVMNMSAMKLRQNLRNRLKSKSF